MTFREELERKISKDVTDDLWKEIQKIFLGIDGKKLRSGIKVHFFSNTGDNIYYIIGDGTTGRKIEGGYTLDDFRKVIPICQKNMLNVLPTKDGAIISL